MRLVSFLPALASFALIPALFTQQAPPRPPQTARQALIEMLTGKTDPSKFLTVEVQKELQKDPGRGAGFSPATVMAGLHSAVAGSRLKTFETGPILYSSVDPKSHERTEVHVDNDDLNADEATLQLSIHQFRDEKEIVTPFQFISQISIGMKKQENAWRLNEIDVVAKVPIGDPALFRQLNEGLQASGTDVAAGGTGMLAYSIGTTPEASQAPKADIQTTLALITFLEQNYAGQHPEQGFICSLSDLMADAGPTQILGLDPQVKTGISNGFRINASGCQGIPSGSYQITAEPLSPSAGNKAFCTDATRNIRASDDGRGATCLVSGKVPVNKNALPEAHIGVQLDR